MKGTSGIVIELASLYPKWPGMMTYLCFFLAGWLLFRNIDKLHSIIRNWRLQLAVGLILTVPYYFYSKHFSEHGYATSKYPQLVVNDFHFSDGKPAYPEFRQKLMTANADSVAGKLWAAIPEPYRIHVRENQSLREDELKGLLGAINKRVLGSAELSSDVDFDRAALSEQAQLVALPARLIATRLAFDLSSTMTACRMLVTAAPGQLWLRVRRALSKLLRCRLRHARAVSSVHSKA